VTPRGPDDLRVDELDRLREERVEPATTLDELRKTATRLVDTTDDGNAPLASEPRCAGDDIDDVEAKLAASESVTDLADSLGLDRSYVGRIVKPALLAPRIDDAIADSSSRADRRWRSWRRECRSCGRSSGRVSGSSEPAAAADDGRRPIATLGRSCDSTTHR